MAPSHQEYRQVAQVVAGWRRPLLVTHTRPDGDAIGCLLALRGMLRAQGSQPLAMLYGSIPPRYAFLSPDDPLTEAAAPSQAADAFAPDGVVVLDTCAYAQLEPIADWLRASPRPLLVLDHHVTRDVPAKHALIDESASATCLILFEWAQTVGWLLAPRVVEALFVGIATDTGWFHHPNTDVRTLEAAARLVERGATPETVYEQIYGVQSPERVRLFGAALRDVELHDGGRIAVMSIGEDHFKQSGATPADTEDLVNEPMRIRGVTVSVLLVAYAPGRVRVSLRSRSPAAGEPEINVADVAASLGGGGHPRAAGARVPGSLESVKADVLQKLVATRRTES
jgi:phosphoesterase RecJ-like protein